jgi:hypothetical protein
MFVYCLYLGPISLTALLSVSRAVKSSLRQVHITAPIRKDTPKKRRIHRYCTAYSITWRRSSCRTCRIACHKYRLPRAVQVMGVLVSLSTVASCHHRSCCGCCGGSCGGCGDGCCKESLANSATWSSTTSWSSSSNSVLDLPTSSCAIHTQRSVISANLLCTYLLFRNQ